MNFIHNLVLKQYLSSSSLAFDDPSGALRLECIDAITHFHHNFTELRIDSFRYYRKRHKNNHDDETLELSNGNAFHLSSSSFLLNAFPVIDDESSEIDPGDIIWVRVALNHQFLECIHRFKRIHSD